MQAEHRKYNQNAKVHGLTAARRALNETLQIQKSLNDINTAIDSCVGNGDPRELDRGNASSASAFTQPNLKTGEGGMVVTHESRPYEKMKLLCLHGISKDAWNRYAEHGNWYYEVVLRIQVQPERPAIGYWNTSTGEAGRVHQDTHTLCSIV